MSSIKDKIANFMTAFEKGQLIGVDIGLNAVKLALLSKSKKTYKLEAFSSYPLSEAAIIEDEIQKPEEIIEAISSCYKNLKHKQKIACIGLDGPNTVIKRLQVGDGTKEEVSDNILWESEQYIPFDVDESEIDFAIIRDIKEREAKDAMVVAVKTDLAERYQHIVKEAGLVPKIIDMKALAISNVFENVYEDRLDEINEDGAVIIDFGAQKTTIIVYKNEGPVLTKEIGFGGVLITEEIQRQMGLSYEEAEDLKTMGDETGSLPEEIMAIIDQKLDQVMEDIKRVLNFYIAAGSSEQVSYCFITGGSALLPGLAEGLSELTGIEVEYLNPFERFGFDRKKFSEDQLSQIASTGVVAMGLGLRSTT